MKKNPRAATSSSKRSIVIASHGHPRLSKGGAENAAYNLFSQLASGEDFAPVFLGCAREPRGALQPAFSQPYGDTEYVYSLSGFDWFKLANRDPEFPAALAQLVARHKPDIFHFHHYLNFGVEVFSLLKKLAPNTKLVVTLHEYLAICHHYGQMVTRNGLAPCHESSDMRCSMCFADRSRADFYLRKQYITGFFQNVDRFIAPSRFLAERYTAWGIDSRRISVIENVLKPAPKGAIKADPAKGKLKLGFFGQISALKGINVLLDAADILEKSGVDDVLIEIHGDYSGQPPEFQADFLERLKSAPRNVAFKGSYEPEQAHFLMSQMHALVVPSIWWENSPIVIQEAFQCGVPVLCSDIGGMAEKVQEQKSGFHFKAGNSAALAALIKEINGNRTQLTLISRTMADSATTTNSIRSHAEFYQSL